MIDIFFLGTGAGKPTLERTLSGTLIRTNQSTILLDCGETTQVQLMKLGISPMRIDTVVISHLHGDHFFGLPGLLQTMDLLQRKNPIKVTGPKGVQDFLECVQEVTTPLTYPLIFQSIEDYKHYKHKDVEITHRKVEHSVDSYATAITLVFKTGRFFPEKAKALGVPEGPLWKSLKDGKPITSESGKTIHPFDVTGEPPLPLKIVYSSDTKPCIAMDELARNATLLIHDSTYQATHQDLAEIALHSTALDAAHIAKKAKVEYLFLTHISPRYKDRSQMLEEAKTVFSNTFIPRDLSHYRITINKKTQKPVLSHYKIP